MALRFCDGFDSYGASADLTKKWASTTADWTWSSTAGRFSGGAVVNAGGSGSGNQLLSQAGVLTASTNCVGLYCKFSTTPASTIAFFRVYSNTAAAQWSLRINATGTVSLYGVNGDNTLEVTSSGSICDNQFHWVEASCAGGFQSLYVDNVAQGTNISSGTSAAYRFALLSVSGLTQTIDDLIVYDSNTGAPISSSFPYNARQITTVRPSSDGTVAYGTVVGGTGTHASCLSETNPDGDTSYVQDAGATTQDLINMGALGYTPTNITVVMSNVYADNPGAGAININGVCKSSATTSSGTAVVTPLSYQTMQFPWPTDPNGGIAWTAANLNAAQFGYKNA